MTDRPGVARAFTYQHDGLTLAYGVVGDGQPILFVHGATATGEFEWGALAAGLAPAIAASCPICAATADRNFAATATTGEAIRADLRYLIDHLETRPARISWVSPTAPRSR